MRFVFSDGEKLGVYSDGAIKKFDSNYIVHYRETATRDAKSKEWKRQGKAARMMSEDYYFEGEDETRVEAAVHGVALTGEENKIVYAFSVNNTSGIYSKLLDDEIKTEAHIVSSNEEEFMSVSSNADGRMLAAVQTDSVTSQIALFPKDSGDYKCLTGGDSLDENPSFDAEGKAILFNSYGVGRDENNNFIEYVPSEICRLNLSTMEVETLASDPKFSYIKPLADSQGNLYCIKKPGTEKTGGNPLLEILLIPVRIVQALAGFVSMFVMCFTGKPLVSGQSGRSVDAGGGAAKNGKADAKKIFINNNLLNVDKELKKNKKQEDYGFIPASWKIVRLGKDGKGETEIAAGAADFCIVEENGSKEIVYTNGKHIFAVAEGQKRRKLADADFCLKVGGLTSAKTDSDLFDLI
mgnify:FL=1|jgi:hypothetical protein